MAGFLKRACARRHRNSSRLGMLRKFAEAGLLRARRRGATMAATGAISHKIGAVRERPIRLAAWEAWR